MSDAVDRAVASVDFRPLSGRSVFLDDTYLKAAKSPSGFITADYITSSLRQQMLAANCYLEEDRAKAEYIVEVRVGALGADSHNMIYGVPQSNGLSTVASFVPNAPPVPIIPEIAFAKRENEMAAAKIALFAYHRETRQAVWQSGIAQARSSAKDLWFFGAGPFQKGTIHDGTQFAGDNLESAMPVPVPILTSEEKDRSLDRLQLYEQGMSFVQPPSKKAEEKPAEADVQPAGHAAPATDAGQPAEAAAAPPAAGAAAAPPS